MLKWALIFFVVSVVAGLLGFTGLSAASAGIAKILFFVAVAIFIIFLVLAFMAGSIAFDAACWPLKRNIFGDMRGARQVSLSPSLRPGAQLGRGAPTRAVFKLETSGKSGHKDAGRLEFPQRAFRPPQTNMPPAKASRRARQTDIPNHNGRGDDRMHLARRNRDRAPRAPTELAADRLSSFPHSRS